MLFMATQFGMRHQAGNHNRLNLFLRISCCLPFFYLSGLAFSAENYEERIIVEFDGREWLAASTSVSESEFTVEYLLRGETLDDWSEQVTTTLSYVKPNTRTEFFPYHGARARVAGLSLAAIYS